MPIPDSVDPRDALLLVIDMQQRLLPHIAERERVQRQVLRMMRAARELEIPIRVSEQYPKGLGATVETIAARIPADAERIEKASFSVCGDAPVSQLVPAERGVVLLVGIETHVCVQLTALDLLRAGLRPIVLADAVGSRRPEDRSVALERMRSAGVDITTVEAQIYDMMVRSGTDLFKRLLPILK